MHGVVSRDVPKRTRQPRATTGAARTVARLVVHRDPNRLSWPPTRTDLLTLVLVLAFAYCLLEDRSFATTVPVLVAAVFVGVSPRMRGRWGWQSGAGSSLGGEFGDPFEGTTRAEAIAPRKPQPDPGSPPKTGSGED